jgi:hypothetical protein
MASALVAPIAGLGPRGGSEMSQGRVGSLEIDQDLEFQRRMWVVQRVGWAAMVLIVVLALLGLFATGPLSSAATETSDGALQIEHGRFARHEALTTLELAVGPQAVANSQVQVRASQSFLDTYSIEQIVPEPDSVALESDGVTWTFSVGELAGPGQITLLVRPERIGFQRSEIGLAGGQTLSFRQLIYP